MRTHPALIAAAILLIGVSHVEAQTARRPTRPYRGLFGGGPPADPNQSRQELSFTSSVLGGYGDVLNPTGSGVGEPTRGTEYGPTAFVDASMRYMYGRTGRSFSIDGGGYSNVYPSLDVDAAVGGNVTLRAETTVARRTTLSLSQDLAYDPTLFLGAYSPLQGDLESGPLPVTGESSGYVTQASTYLASRAGADQRWNASQSTSVSYVYSRRNYLDALGFDSHGNAITASHSWAVSRTVSVNGSYGYSSDSFSGLGAGVGPSTTALPVDSQNFEAGVSQAKRLSPSRQLRLSAGAGATRVNTVSTLDDSPLQYWMPSGHGSIGVDLGRSWAVAADYRRAVSVLQGVTLESFATGAAQVVADGTLSRRIETSLSAAFANGQSGSGEQPSSYVSYTGEAQIRYALSRCCAMSVNYSYYYYKLHDVSPLPTGVPPQFDSNAVRVGFTFWLPLYGSYADSPERRRPRGTR